jgi:hypothetical protein
MKNAILLHGTSCAPSSYWLPSIRAYLERNGYSVWAPQLPDADTPDLKSQLPFILENFKFGKDTIIVGHSAGGPLTLAILEAIKTKVRRAVLVAGYARPKGKNPVAEAILKDYDWKRIRNNVDDIIFINSDNDPWGCDDKEGRYMFDQLGGKLIILHGEGHMGSDSFNQPYKEFPLLQSLLFI